MFCWSAAVTTHSKSWFLYVISFLFFTFSIVGEFVRKSYSSGEPFFNTETNQHFLRFGIIYSIRINSRRFFILAFFRGCFSFVETLCNIFFMSLIPKWCHFRVFNQTQHIRNCWDLSNVPTNIIWRVYASETHILCLNSIFLWMLSLARCLPFWVCLWQSFVSEPATDTRHYVWESLFIRNGITHKSRENNENDIFICYRL